MRLSRIFRLTARARYWKQRALKSERFLVAEQNRLDHTITLLRDELNAEMNRNREREDTFMSATVMGGRNMYGVAARIGPALKRQEAAVASQSDPWQQLPWEDRAEFATEWWPGAQAVGRSEMQARQDFMQELAKRKQLNDEPFSIQ